MRAGLFVFLLTGAPAALMESSLVTSNSKVPSPNRIGKSCSWRWEAKMTALLKMRNYVVGEYGNYGLLGDRSSGMDTMVVVNTRDTYRP